MYSLAKEWLQNHSLESEKKSLKHAKRVVKMSLFSSEIVSFREKMNFSLFDINLSSPKGRCNNPSNSFRFDAQNTQPRGEIVPGTCKFHLFYLFWWKIIQPIYHLPREKNKISELRGHGGCCDPVNLKFGYFENIWSDMHSKLYLQLTTVISHVLIIFNVKNQIVLILFYKQNCNFSTFEGVLKLWRHSEVTH